MEIIISRETNSRRSASSRSSSSSSARSTGPRAVQRPASSQRSSSSQRSGAQRASTQRSSSQRPSQGNYRRKKKRGVSPVLIILIVALVLAIAVAGGIGVYAMRYADYDKILPNVYVAGIDVGGMTVEEATRAIESSMDETVQQSVNVILPDRTLTFTPEQDTVLVDVDKAVEKAYSYGRTNTSPFAMARAIKAAQRTRNNINISSAVEIDTNYIHNLIDTTAAEVDTPKVDSDVQVDTENRTITVTIGTPGKELDSDALYNLVADAFSSGDYEDISFDYTMTYPATVGLDRLYEQLSAEPKDAIYNPDTKTVESEVVGYVPTVSLDDANAQLASAAAGDTLVFEFEETIPEMTAEQLSSMLFRDTLYSYATAYVSNANRTTNLRLACEAINGTVLQPGEVFSFNDVVGERTKEKGYKEGTIYIDSKSEPALGGGICQVASTIYYCCLYADLEVVHREAHMFRVSYVPYGMDATIYWGSVDFQFRNSTDYPLRIDSYLSNGRVYIGLVGTDVDHHSVEIDVDTVKADSTGYIYTITRYVYDSDGNLIRTDTTEDLDNMGGMGTSVHKVESSSSNDNDDTTAKPSPSPSETPSASPSASPSATPSTAPSTQPTQTPTQEPTPPPTQEPTQAPTQEPTPPPTQEPEPPSGGGEIEITPIE